MRRDWRFDCLTDLLARRAVTALCKFPLQRVEFLVRAILQVDEVVARFAHAVDHLIELEMQRPGIAVLSVLDKKYDRKSSNGRARVDDELPSIRKMKKRPYRRL